MPVYEFETASGEPREVFFWMGKAPEIGATIEHDGETLTRVPSTEGGIVKEYRHVSHQLPRVDPSNPYWPHYDEKNRPVFTSKKQVEELSARIGHYGGNIRFGN